MTKLLAEWKGGRGAYTVNIVTWDILHTQVVLKSCPELFLHMQEKGILSDTNPNFYLISMQERFVIFRVSWVNEFCESHLHFVT